MQLRLSRALILTLLAALATVEANAAGGGGCILLPPPPLPNGEDACHPASACSLNSDCVQAPTSLPAVDINVVQSSGYVAGVTPCGTYTCMFFFRCCCGNRFGTSVCDG